MEASYQRGQVSRQASFIEDEQGEKRPPRVTHQLSKEFEFLGTEVVKPDEDHDEHRGVCLIS